MNPSQADGRTLAGRYLAMLNDHDPDGVDGFVAVDYINTIRWWRTDVKATAPFWRDFFAAFPDIETTMDDLVVAGDRRGRTIHLRCARRSPLRNTCDREADRNASIDIWRMENGEFVEHWDELNLLELFQQIGMIPAFGVGAA